MDLIDDPRPGQNAPEFTVSELSSAVKRALETEFGRVRVRGEVGRVVRARSGHMYFDVKDGRNTLACTTWKGQVAGLSVLPDEGMEVVVTGRMTAYGGQSKYNLNVDDVTVAGQGALLAMLEKRKAKLQSEGLFEEARKRPLPFLPEVIGVVTSPTGAVIRDILHRLRDRFPRQVLVWPVAVQGSKSASEVAAAIQGFNAINPGDTLLRPDLIIVARGGGSIEDLWGFNEEAVVRAAAASEIPLISAVGHETDTTLIDFASDRRAPTPTAAAEMAVPVRLELLSWVEAQGARASAALVRGVETRGQRLRDLARALPRPEGLTSEARQRLDLLDQRLANALRAPVRQKQLRFAQVSGGLKAQLLTARVERSNDRVLRLAERLGIAQSGRLERARERLATLERLRENLGYRATLARGFSVVRSEGTIVTSLAAAKVAQSLEIEFLDGRHRVGAPSRKKPKRKTSPESDQRTLF
ncbi:MAG: exodeoxyribonuclease VII large subunit [Pseudomonadota bacterium]